jgi:hypothetical protein
MSEKMITVDHEIATKRRLPAWPADPERVPKLYLNRRPRRILNSVFLTEELLIFTVRGDDQETQKNVTNDAYRKRGME